MTVNEFALYIQPAFQYMQWEWSNYEDNIRRIPSVGDIANQLEELIAMTKEDKGMHGSGRLFSCYNGEVIEFGLMFNA